MIQNQSQIIVNALPEEVFATIEKMPNKFPVYKIIDTKPIFFLRALFVDGWRYAINSIKIQSPIGDTVVMNVGDSYGPFKLTEVERPSKYWFTLDSFFFSCRTGYTLTNHGNKTLLQFILVTENPFFKEKIYWIRDR